MFARRRSSQANEPPPTLQAMQPASWQPLPTTAHEAIAKHEGIGAERAPDASVAMRLRPSMWRAPFEAIERVLLLRQPDPAPKPCCDAQHRTHPAPVQQLSGTRPHASVRYATNA